MRGDELESIDLPQLRGLIDDQPGLQRVLAGIAAGVRERILEHEKALNAAAPGFERRFVQPFKAIKRIEFDDLDSGAAFVLDEPTRVMTFNTGHVRSLLDAIMRDVDTATERLAPGEIGRLARLAIELLILHEVRHLSQGVGDYGDVQKLKAISEMLVGEFDLLADRDAAQAYALLRTLEEGTAKPVDYVRFFAEAIFFMGQYCFPAFKAPLNKPSKVARALGLTLMVARIARADVTETIDADHAGRLPLDTALVPEIAPDWTKLTIFAYNPDLQLVSVAVEVDILSLYGICERLDDGNFDELVEDVVRFIRTVPLI